MSRTMAKKAGVKRQTVTDRSQLILPVSRISKMPKGQKISMAARIGLTAVVEYVVSEVLDLAGTAAKENKMLTIGNRHILLAIKNDEELNKVFKDAVFRKGGVLPHIHAVLIPRKKTKKTA